MLMASSSNDKFEYAERRIAQGHKLTTDTTPFVLFGRIIIEVYVIEKEQADLLRPIFEDAFYAKKDAQHFKNELMEAFEMPEEQYALFARAYNVCLHTEFKPHFRNVSRQFGKKIFVLTDEDDVLDDSTIAILQALAK